MFKTVRHFDSLRPYRCITPLGQGQNGSVTHVRLNNGVEAAIKRFKYPDLALDCTVRLLRVAPDAYDFALGVKTRAAFDANGVFVHVQQLCTPISFNEARACELVLEALQTLPTTLARMGVSHDDIKRDNFVWETPAKKKVLLCDLDSLTATTNGPRPAREDGIGAHTQFIFGATQMPDTIPNAIQLAAYRDADFHLAYQPVQLATMLFSCLMTAIGLVPFATKAEMPPIWHIAIKNRCCIDMEVLRTHALHHEALFVAFCDAWARAMPLIMAEPAAATILRRY
jgi:hypothetical protein